MRNPLVYKVEGQNISAEEAIFTRPQGCVITMPLFRIQQKLTTKSLTTLGTLNVAFYIIVTYGCIGGKNASL